VAKVTVFLVDIVGTLGVSHHVKALDGGILVAVLGIVDLVHGMRMWIDMDGLIVVVL
jgi:hypothetical protein